MCIRDSTMTSDARNSTRNEETNEKWMKSPSNFERLVLGCMDSYDSDQRLILQHFSRSTRFAFLCTAQISKFQPKIVQISPDWKWNFIFIALFDEICDFSAKVWWTFSGISPEFHRNGQEMTNCLEILWKSARKIRKNARNFRKLWKFPFSIPVFHSSP